MRQMSMKLPAIFGKIPLILLIVEKQFTIITLSKHDLESNVKVIAEIKETINWGAKNMPSPQKLSRDPLIFGVTLTLTAVKQYADPHPIEGGQHY